MTEKEIYEIIIDNFYNKEKSFDEIIELFNDKEKIIAKDIIKNLSELDDDMYSYDEYKVLTSMNDELNESYYDDDFYLKELLDKLEDNRRAIEIYTLDITQPDEEYALTQEEKDRTIKMLKEYYKQAEEKEKILESILEEAQGIYRNYAEIVRQEKIMIEDAFEELNIPLEESLTEDVYDDAKHNFKHTYGYDTAAQTMKKSEVVNNQIKIIRGAMGELADYLDKWYSKYIAPRFAMSVDLSGFDNEAYLIFRNSLSLSPEQTSQLDKFRNESLKENKKKKNYLKQLQDYANKHQKGLGRFTKYGGKTNTNAGNVEVNNAFFNSVASSNSSQAMGNGGQAMGEKLTLCEDKIDEKELAQLSSGLYNYFVDNDLYVEDIWTQDGQICYDINRGDWKHEHGRSTYLANNFLFDKGYYISSLEQEVTEDDGSDTYSAIHKITVEPILKESLNENYVVVGIDKEQNRKFYDEDSNEWTEDEGKATIYQTTEEVRNKWNDIDKENFEKVFCPLYDKREEE